MIYSIAIMKTNKSLGCLEEEISEIKKQLCAVGPMHPGSVSRQFQVCGNPSCRCMHPEKPQRHGPYHKLAYVYHGKPVCRFVRFDCVEKVKKRVDAYKTFRKLMDRWINLSIQQGIIEFFAPPQSSSTAKARTGKK